MSEQANLESSDMIPDHVKKNKDQPAEEEDALDLSKGPMTRARSKKLKEAIGGLIRKSLKKESLEGSLILQDPLITIQVIIPSS